MERIADVIEWLRLQPEDSMLAVDDGGLALVVLVDDPRQGEIVFSGSYYELGGTNVETHNPAGTLHEDYGAEEE